MGRFLIVDDVEERIGKSENGACVQAVGSDAGVFRKGEMGAVNKRHTVEEEELGAGGLHGGVREVLFLPNVWRILEKRNFPVSLTSCFFP